MNGAESLLATLEANDVEVCFANPGTSEMHFVAALDNASLRGVLGLFEGVVTGAADGYGRMTGKPAATLLHLGPGMANGLSNLHNALRAQSPIVNIIGDHASYHRDLDAPLTSDIEGAARPFSHWVRTTHGSQSLAQDTAEAIQVSREGKIASLILPADAAWNPVPDGHDIPRMTEHQQNPVSVEEAAVVAAAKLLKAEGSRTALLLGTRSASESSLAAAAAIARETGATVLHNTAMSRIPRGAGRHSATRIPYPIAASQELLEKFDNVILVGAEPPVAFFAYPDKPSRLTTPGTRCVELASGFTHSTEALEALRASLGDLPEAPRTELHIPEVPTGSITPEKLGVFLGASLPEQAIVVDESITTGRTFFRDTATARPHDWLTGTGGSIGYAMPTSIGAAIACPDRPVITLESDGSGMYMPQALWTQAREQLNITTLIFANRKYEILRQEMKNVGVAAFGDTAAELLDLQNPAIDWVSMSQALGVPARRAQTMEELAQAFSAAVVEPGPNLIEVVL